MQIKPWMPAWPAARVQPYDLNSAAQYTTVGFPWGSGCEIEDSRGALPARFCCLYLALSHVTLPMGQKKETALPEGEPVKVFLLLAQFIDDKQKFERLLRVKGSTILSCADRAIKCSVSLSIYEHPLVARLLFYTLGLQKQGRQKSTPSKSS